MIPFLPLINSIFGTGRAKGSAQAEQLEAEVKAREEMSAKYAPTLREIRDRLQRINGEIYDR